MVSVLLWSKTAYLVISKNRPISRLKKKNVIKGGKNMILTQVALQGTSGAEILYFARSLCSEYGFGTLEV